MGMATTSRSGTGMFDQRPVQESPRSQKTPSIGSGYTVVQPPAPVAVSSPRSTATMVGLRPTEANTAPPAITYDYKQSMGTSRSAPVAEKRLPNAPAMDVDSSPMSSETSIPASSDKGVPSDAQAADEARNVVVFGETGVGKSSVINMIMDYGGSADIAEVAPVSSGAVGCTFASKGYPATIDGMKYMFWDTAGLNEGAKGSVTHQESIVNLASLINQLEGKVHLLVYCIRGKRFRQVIKDNYDLFFNRVCERKVTIILVITGLENETPNMENWWRENQEEFYNYGLRFGGHACITAFRGKLQKDGGHLFDEEYQESQAKVVKLLKEKCGIVAHKLDVSLDDAFEDPPSPTLVDITKHEQGPLGFSRQNSIDEMFHHFGKAMQIARKLLGTIFTPETPSARGVRSGGGTSTSIM